MRALGFEPSKEEMKQLLGQVDKESAGTMDFSQFLQVMTKKMVCS